LVIALGFDPIWYGVIMVIMMEMGMITPPVGINVYVIKGVAKGVPIEVIFKGVLPFLVAMIVCVIILIAFPQIALFLPNLLV
jgi:C4-dicarboxylate transporter DctM subunit